MSDIVKQLAATLSADQVLTDDATRDSRRHDYWMRSWLADHQDNKNPSPLCVVQPHTTQEVSDVVKLCRKTGTALVPFGLGSGVCGGVQTSADQVLLDMGKMTKMISLDETNLLVTFQAGRNGLEAENLVAEKGFTIGHWPQSIAVSSVGGWVATRASGQYSTANGNIEDIIYTIEAVLPDGTIINTGKGPRAAAGPDLRHILLGSEGTMGVITQVTFKILRKAEKVTHTAYHIADLPKGFDFQREILQSGWRPPVMRQYDASEAKRNFPDQAREDIGMLIMVHEGPTARVDVELAAIEKIATQYNLEKADTAAVTRWLDQRNHVPTWTEFLDNGIILDTVEISANWDRIGDVYDAAIAALKELPNMLNASAHSSHGYANGLNLYFTFAGRPEDSADMAQVYDAGWKAIMEATAAQGGSVAHHHGIGRVRKNYLEHDLGAGGVALLRALKATLDPDNLMNPGVLLPDA